jgi:hypothetical protein
MQRLITSRSLAKPLYLPVWLCDYVSIVHARLDGVDHDLDVSTFDMMLPGTQVPPLGRTAVRLPKGEALADLLEDYEPSEHLELPENIRMDEDTSNVVPVAFTLFPSGVSESISRAFTAIRDEDVRIPGDANTVLFAAYPIYVPYYLIDYMDDNPQAGPDGRKVSCFRKMLFAQAHKLIRTILQVTTCVQGRESGVGKGMTVQDAVQAYSLPQWWCEEEQVWLPEISYRQSFDVQGYRRNRPSPSQDESPEKSDFSSMSPIKSAQAAARSGSYQGSGVGEEAERETVSSLRKKAEHAGQLMIEAMRDVLQPLRTNTTPNQAPAEFSEIARKMDQVDSFMEYMPHAQLNRQYVEKVNEMRIAQESLKVSSSNLDVPLANLPDPSVPYSMHKQCPLSEKATLQKPL